MTREEETNNASYTYWVNNYANIEFIDEEEKELHTQDIQDSFINGAEWADQNPSTETINRIITIYKRWYSEQSDVSMVEYIKSNWNNEDRTLQ